MRKYYDIHLDTQTITEEHLEGEQIARAGRYHIAKTLLDNHIAPVDPLSPDNILIFSAGPFAGSSFSNANRLSVGCKSPLTGGIKEANAGGTCAYAMGQLEISGFNLRGASNEWVVLHFHKDGALTFDDAQSYMGLGTFETVERLYATYGKKVSLAICGPVGEYLGLLAGISITDTDGRPSRLAARGGVGAVMGSKKVKAIVLDLVKMPPFHDRKKVLDGIKTYAKKLQDDPAIEVYTKIGTMNMGDYTNHVGGLPVRNFTAGGVSEPGEEFKMGGDYITALNNARGGEHTHACMPGCVIQCSNVFVDAAGKEIASPVEYETIGLMGTNCGIMNVDDLAAVNWIANDLGIDSIEAGATLGVLMDAGLAEFGDMQFMKDVLQAIREGTDEGRLWAQGTARVGEHYGIQRVPVIKKQAISAYDPRVIEITGVSMMTTAQGADHTAGNVPKAKSFEMDLAEIKQRSLESQIVNAIPDSLGLCIFGRTVTDTNPDFIVETINAAHGTNLKTSFFRQLGMETLLLEAEFNKQAGFGVDDDRLPQFFYDEALTPSNRVARFRAEEVQDIYEPLPEMHAKLDAE
ncbi:MAG: aldehyde ferredoxin oxidoreductase [Anaerolineaceae bacterium]|nr:aldehyde ferredoxin oxidoreductase [Anaerolineaceae bacterium]